MLTIEQLAKWSGGSWHGLPPACIEGVCIDTRRLRPGELFVALQGETRDGHDFVAEAFTKGAGGAVVSRVDALPRGTAGLLVRDTTRALQDMAAGYRCTVNPRVIGVTGSVGKSTVKDMTACMLATRMPTAHTHGNWNNDIGLPLSLLSMAADTEAVVLEMGTNHPGELKVLCDIARPDRAIVTNVGPVHTEFFESVQAIAEEKATLLRWMTAGGLAVLNRDNDFFDYLATQVPGEVCTVSFEQAADYQCLRWNPATREAVVLEASTGAETVLQLALPGAFNVVNALLAAAVARAEGVAWSDIGAVLHTFKGGPLRWEEMDRGGLHVINDAYNANPINMRGSIGVFAAETTPAARWLVLGGMLELGAREREEHVALGRYVGQGPWAGVIVVGDPGRIIAEGAIAAGFPAARLFRCEAGRDVPRVLREHAAAGSRVLLKGSRRFHLETVAEELES